MVKRSRKEESGTKCHQETTIKGGNEDQSLTPADTVEGLESAKKPKIDTTTSREVTTIVVRNIPLKFNYFKLKRFFQDCGGIRSVNIQESSDQRSKIARIEFSHFGNALSALTKNHKKIAGNEISVDLLADSTIWTTNYPLGYGEPELKRLFSQFGGTVLSVRLPSLRFNSHRRFAYIDMASPQEANIAISQLNGITMDSFQLVVARSSPVDAKKRTDAATLERREVLVQNLDFTMSESDLRDLFSRFGNIERITLPQSGSTNNDGYGFVIFESVECAKQGLSLDHTEFEGRELRVQLADRKSYLERQQVKRILTSKKSQDNVVAIYPVSDKIRVEQIQNLITERSGLLPSDIVNLYLVSDLEGAIVILEDAQAAGRATMALNGVTLNKTIINCGTVNELQRQKMRRAASVGTVPISNTSAETFGKKETPLNKQGIMTNQDFRQLLLQKPSK
ncbi:LAMI_0A05072g1_1 [Lachancea mirantina]|uniref:LAMI_0A05072g1_1 n=1 Tax=Lachancea mirantina TaxID=1230905 RepID=A0A1G4IPZ6_9SACH|nr:LAMI_0A05072g1_1 [Lachancea mirantina]